MNALINLQNFKSNFFFFFKKGNLEETFDPNFKTKSDSSIVPSPYDRLSDTSSVFRIHESMDTLTKLGLF